MLHEFSTIAGVREDVTDIVLNIKSLALRLHSDTPKRMYLKVKGPAVVTAGMIECGHDIEIMDTDHVICHLDEEAELSIEMTVCARGVATYRRHRTSRRMRRSV